MDKGVGGPENWTIFMDVIYVSSLTSLYVLRVVDKSKGNASKREQLLAYNLRPRCIMSLVIQMSLPTRNRNKGRN